MNESNQNLADRIRALVSSGALAADYKDLLAEYQKRADQVNVRLSAASTWLKAGLLSEAIGHSEEFPDAVDTARELDLGRANMDRLIQTCHQFGMEVPTGVNLQAAWELSTAYTMYLDSRGAIDAYRGECMAGAPPWDRLLVLRDACAMVAKFRGQIGPTGDAIERSLSRQAIPLFEARRLQLKQRMIIAQRTGDSTLAKRARDAFGELLGVIRDLNKSHAEIKLDLTGDPILRELQTSIDRHDLNRLVLEVAAHRKQGNAEALRTTLKDIEEIVLNGFARVPPADEPKLKEAKEDLRRRDEQSSRQFEAQKRLRAMIDDPASTLEQREGLYNDSRQAGLTIPDDLNDAHHARNEADLLVRRQKAVALWKRGALYGGAALAALLLIVLVWLYGPSSHPKADTPQRTLVSDVRDLLDAGDIEKAKDRLYATAAENGSVGDEKSPQDLEKAHQALLADPTTRDITRRLDKAMFDALYKKLTGPGIGRTASDVDDAKKLVLIANGMGESDPPGNDRVALGEGRLKKNASELLDKITKQYDATQAADTTALATSLSVEKSLTNAEGEQSKHPPEWLLEKYTQALAAHDKQIAGKTSLSDKASEKIEKIFDKIRLSRDELAARIDLTNAVTGGRATLADLVHVYNAYHKLPNARPEFAAPIGSVLKNQDALVQAAQCLDALAIIGDASAPQSKGEASKWHELFDRRFAALYPGIDTTDLDLLQGYFAAYESFYEKQTLAAFDATEQEFAQPRWSQLSTVVDDKGQRYYSVGGSLKENPAPGFFDLTECATNTSQFLGKAKKLSPLIPVGNGRKLESLGLAAMADSIASLMRDAKDRKAERLTAHLIAAQRIRNASMPPPLKAKALRDVVSVQLTVGWPDTRACQSILSFIEQGGERLNDGSPWAPGENDIPGIRDTFRSFEASLAGIEDMEVVARERADRVRATARRAGAIGLIGIAWKAQPEGVAWTLERDGSRRSPLARSAVYVIDGDGDAPKLRRVGQVKDNTTITWDSQDQPPPDGVPLLAERSRADGSR